MSSRRRTRRAVLLTLGALVVTLGGLWYRNDRAVRMFVFEQYRYFHYRTGDDRILNDLSAGRIRPGDDVEEFIARYPASDAIIRHDDYVTLYYSVRPGGSYEEVVVIAKGGRLIAAVAPSCTYRDVFFVPDDPAGAAAYHKSLTAEQDRRWQARRTAELAAAGFGATFEPRNLPQPAPGDER